MTDFIEFMMKDYPPFQHRMRGGLMWLEHYSNTQYGLSFEKLSTEQQIEIIDAIAYPDSASKEVKHGVEFFNLIRNLVCTGFFTTKMGVDYLGYQGNRPNQWDGVPEEVMQKYGVELDEKYASVYLDIESQNTIVQWDDEGNIIG